MTPSIVPTIVGVITVGIWIYLLAARGRFWRLRAFDADRAAPQALTVWPRVVAIVPARNEVATIGQTVESLLAQNYPGEHSVVVVDDHSEDGTASAAQDAARGASAESRVTVISALKLPPDWTGKLWALNEGITHAGMPAPDFYWFTDADIVHAPDTLTRLVAPPETQKLDLVSLMVLLHAETFAEKLLIPAFLFFFLKLYPPQWIADPRSRSAGAAGGCILLRRSALERIGGLAAIRGEVIDDCALARAVKHSGSAIWMGLTRKSISLRTYNNFGEIRDMIARTAFTQLRHSFWLLLGTLAGIFFTYLAPVILLFAHHCAPRILGMLAWLLMTVAFLPTLRFYRLPLFYAPLLPVIALFYFNATCLSALRYWLGRGGQWKGRSQTH